MFIEGYNVLQNTFINSKKRQFRTDQTNLKNENREKIYRFGLKNYQIWAQKWPLNLELRPLQQLQHSNP